MKIVVLHGVNLNMFGVRNPKHYGHATLDDINQALEELARELGVELETFQTNYEGAMVERIQALFKEDVAAIVINAGAWTHTSLAIHDALEILTIPIVEVHMSNIHNREKIRQTSLLASVAKGSIAGFGVDSYLLGLRAAASLATQKTNLT